MKTHYISTDKTIDKRVIKHGKITNKPIETSICHLEIEDVLYESEHSKYDDRIMGSFRNLLNSKILTGDSTITFVIGEANCEVDRKIEHALKWMGENETALISVKMKMEQICETVENIIIKIEIKLIGVESSKFIWEWSPEVKYEKSLSWKNSGVTLVEENRIKDAFYRFSKAVKLLITLEPIDDLELDEILFKNINKLRTSLYNNMAMCQLKRKNYQYTIDLCTKVLSRDPNNIKAMYRRAQAYGNLKNIQHALNDFQKLVHIEPSNIAAREYMKTYCELWENANKRSDELLKNMFLSITSIETHKN